MNLAENLAPKKTNSLTEVAVNNWVIVKFPDPKVKTKKYIGKITGVHKGRFVVDYVRPKATRDHSGYVYTYPSRRDKNLINFNQIVQVVDDPLEWRRGSLKFDVHYNSLK